MNQPLGLRTVNPLGEYFSREPLWLQQTSQYGLTSTTNEQKCFNQTANGRLTIPAGVFEFACFLYLLSMSGTSGNCAFDAIGAGTATTDRWGWQGWGADNVSPLNGNTCGTSASVTQQSGTNVVSATVGTGLQLRTSGLFRATVGGTIIPSISLVTAASATVEAGSWFMIRQIGLAGQSSSGQWD